MRRQILAGAAAAAVVIGGTIAVTESPAAAHDGCTLIHLQIANLFGPGDLIHICPLG